MTQRPSASKKKAVELSKARKQHKKSIPFPIIAIGASAGGLEALTDLFKSLPGKTGMAYIIVQHLSKDHASHLPSLLAKSTKMQVREVAQMDRMKPDTVYVIPHDKGIEVTDGHIRLIARSGNLTANAIDVLFSSLAKTHKGKMAGIILSGNGHDGTKGMEAIKDAGGMTIAQNDSAQSGSMPVSAIEAGIVDFILSPGDIAKLLIKYREHQFTNPLDLVKTKPAADAGSFVKTILEILYKQVNVDFSRYKMSTINRRINHRIIQSDVSTLKEYVKLLTREPKEVTLLYKDLLINVTSFFRDEKSIHYLKNTFFPALLKRKKEEDTLRVWVPGCSTGEEAYSLAIVIADLQEKNKTRVAVQIFATDLSDQAIHVARIGEYSKQEVERVPKHYLKKYFIRTGDRYRVTKEIRALCIFAPHNILRDPPFSHLDFISCCNLLIYLDTAAQKKVMATFHFSLKDEGHLLLGKSETVGSVSSAFTQVTKAHKLYSRKKNGGVRTIPDLSPRFAATSVHDKNSKPQGKKQSATNSIELDKIVDSILLSSHMPACVIINRDMEIVKFRGQTSLYLRHPSGNASLNIFKMTRPEFAFELRSAINQATKTKTTILKSGIRLHADLKSSPSTQTVTIEVTPLKAEWDDSLLLIVFTAQEQVEKFTGRSKGRKVITAHKDLTIKKQEEELKNMRAEMHAIIEAKETAYEELQAANEEILSANEEFQTLNEELETSKEEIESTNEELITANQELRTRNEQLAEMYDFATSILTTLHEPFLVLDKELRVKSANDAFYQKFSMTPAETESKFLFELGNRDWDVQKLEEMLSNLVRKNTSFKEYEISGFYSGIGQRTFLLNARPIVQKTYNEHLILLAITDITERSVKENSEKEGLKHIISKTSSDLEKSHDTLAQKNVYLERMNKELETFTFISSHDLQEPLRKVQNFASCLLLEENDNLSKDGKNYLKWMQETVSRMKKLIEDLLSYSRAKNTNEASEQVGLNALFNEVRHELRQELKKKKASVKIQGDGHIKAVRFQVRQLLHNLMSNALKFSAAKRPLKISIACAIADGKKLKVAGLDPQTRYCHISFSDNGIGFDPQYKDRIFEVFQRLHAYDTYNGTGIGLAICKRIVENHQGVMTATGKLNAGARFDVYLPVG